MKFKLLLLLLSLMPTFQLLAQKTEIDSLAIKTELVKKDVRHFYLNKQDWKACRKQHFKPTSDYFKPNANHVSNANMLSDSNYVKAYRAAAYKKIKRKRTILRVESTGWILYGIIFSALVVIIVPSILRFK